MFFIAAVALLAPVNLWMITSTANAVLDPIVARRRLKRLQAKTGPVEVFFQDIGSVALTEEELKKLEENGALDALLAAKKRERDLKAVGAR